MLTAVRTGDPSVVATDPAHSRPDRLEVIALAAIVALGTAVRFATIAHQSYWVDEATTVHELQLSLGGLLHAVRVQESTPPLYYLLAWVWAKVFGTGEVGLRSLSALAGTALIPVAWATARELISRGAALVVAAFTALNPFLIWYSQEARAYMLFALLCGLSLLFFARALRRGGGRDLGLWAVFSVLALLTHFFAGFLLAPQALWLLWRLRSRASLVAVASVGAVQVALLPLSLSDHASRLDWISVFALHTRIQQVPVDFGLSTLYQSPTVTYGLLGAGVLAVIVAALLWLGGGPRRRRGAALSAAVAAFALLVPVALAALGTDYLVARNLIGAWLPVAIVVAAACTAPRTIPLGALLAAVLLGAFVYALVKIDSTPQYQRPDWRGVARALGSAGGPRAIVAYDSSYAAAPLSIYLPRVPWGVPAPGAVRVSEVDVVSSTYAPAASTLPAGVRRLSARTVGEFSVRRFAVDPAWTLPVAAIAQRAATLVPGPPGAAVLIQPPA